MENFITRFARYYTPVVTIGAVILAIVPPLFFGGVWREWIERQRDVSCDLLPVCACDLGAVGIFGGIGAASRWAFW